MTIAMEIPRAGGNAVATTAPAGASAHGYETSSRSSAAWRWAIVMICMASALVGRLAYLAQPFDDDGAMFVYLGRVVTEGGRFCHDVVDNKFPTVGLTTSLAYRAFGSWWPGYVLVQTAMGI